jgi:hypothetical protein
LSESLKAKAAIRLVLGVELFGIVEGTPNGESHDLVLSCRAQYPSAMLGL